MLGASAEKSGWLAELAQTESKGVKQGDKLGSKLVASAEDNSYQATVINSAKR